MSDSKGPNKGQEVLEVISRLFASKGYHATSMRDIAQELNMNKSSLYYYMNSKEEMLFQLINSALDESLEIVGEICGRDIPAEEKLEKVLQFYVLHYGKRKEALKLLVNEVDSLSEKYRNILIEKQRRFVNLMESIFQELIAEGKIEGIPPAIATFAFFGMAHYTIRWYDWDGPVSVDELARMFLKIFTQGILE